MRAVTRGALRAIEKDLPILVINPRPVMPLLGLAVLFPRLAEWLSERLGIQDAFRAVGRAHRGELGRSEPVSLRADRE